MAGELGQVYQELIEGVPFTFPEPAKPIKTGYAHTIRMLHPRKGQLFLEDKEYAEEVTRQVNGAIAELINGENGLARWFDNLAFISFTHSVNERPDGTVAIHVGVSHTNTGRRSTPLAVEMELDLATKGRYHYLNLNRWGVE